MPAAAATPRVIVVGAGPGGLAAAARLRDRARGAVQITMLAAEARATFLAGTLDVAVDGAAAEHFSTRVRLDGVEVIDAVAEAVTPDGVVIDGERRAADAVIAAPGLALGPLPDWPRARGAWDPAGAAVACAGLPEVEAGRVVVAVLGAPYRCPPAPFALAVGLAGRHAARRHMTRVTVTTPEPLPLAGVGGEAPALVLDACAAAGVSVERGFAVDVAASEDGVLRSVDGREVRYDAAFLIPPHVRSACLASLAGEGPLVTVDASGAVAGSSLYVIGDAAATGLPRAAGIAAGTAWRAADDVLARLGIAPLPEPEPLRASCFMWHHGGAVSRLRVSFEEGSPAVEIDPPSLDLRLAREGERRRFLAAAGALDAERSAPPRAPHHGP
jgi:sulfide:quinone oxidoreductase